MGVADPALNYQNFVYLYSAFFFKINLQIRKFCCIFAVVLGSKEQEAKNKDLLP